MRTREEAVDRTETKKLTPWPHATRSFYKCLLTPRPVLPAPNPTCQGLQATGNGIYLHLDSWPLRYPLARWNCISTSTAITSLQYARRSSLIVVSPSSSPDPEYFVRVYFRRSQSAFIVEKALGRPDRPPTLCIHCCSAPSRPWQRPAFRCAPGP